MISALFWLGVAIPLYTHAGYPLLMWLRARLTPPLQPPPEPAIWPPVTLIIAAYNEESVLEEKLQNALAMNFPQDRLEIIVVSDGSTDRTDEIAQRFASQGVRWLRLEGRQGKTAAQNAAVEVARGEILVFSDANAMYDPLALRRLVRWFSWPQVGCVEGRRVDAAATSDARCERAYRDWESRIKTWESRTGSCTGATGPIYAIRRSLYIPLPPDLISDLMEPLLIVSRYGVRHIYEPNAISRELIAARVEDEFRRKVRIMTRCLHSLRRMPEVLNPFRRPGFAWRVWSHRLLRWLAPLFFLLALTANMALLDRPFHRFVALASIALLLAAALGALFPYRSRHRWFLLRAPYAIVAAQGAALIAIINCLTGRTIATWHSGRSTVSDATTHRKGPSSAGQWNS